MPNDTSLSIIVRLKDEASAQLASLAAKVQDAGKTIGDTTTSVGAKMTALGSNMQTFGKNMESTGRTLSIGLSLPILALGTDIVSTSMKFQASMELIRTQAGATQGEVDKMTTAVLALAKSGETGQGPQALADGLYHIESLGYRGAQALDILTTSAQAADLGLADMEGVTNALGAAVVTGIKGTQSMQQAMGLLDATIGQGNMRMDDLVAALGTGILPTAKNFGLSLQDVGAALATLTDNGMRADEAATRLRMSFSLMAAPSSRASEQFAAIGLSQLQLADDMRSGGLIKAMQDLKDHLDATGFSASKQADILSKAFGGGKSDAAILTLLEQLDRLKMKYDAIGASADTFAEKVNATHQTNQFKLNAALAQMQATMIDLGGTVMPIFAQILDKVSAGMERFAAAWDKLSPSTQQWIVIALALLAVLGPILVVVGSLITAIGVITSAIGTLILAFGKLTTTVAAGELEMSAFALAAAPWLVVLGALAAAVYLVADAYGKMKDEQAAAMASASAAYADANKANAEIAKLTDPARIAATKAARDASIAASNNSVSANTGGIGTALLNFMRGNGSIQQFAQGGVVQGRAGQAVPIIAHAGETVVPANRSTGQGNTYILNFPGVIAGDDGIRQIISRAVGELNRTTTLRTAGV